MKQARSTKMILLKSATQRLSKVEEAVLFLLHEHGPLTIEELVGRLPDFRWGDVLKVLSKLWGEGAVELEGQPGQLRIRFVHQFEPSSKQYLNPEQKSENRLELTIS